MSVRSPFAGHETLAATAPFVGPPPLLLGHRGSPREAPENTLASLRRALEVGLDGIEYDLRACAGGDLVLMHDEDLERTTDARGPLAGQGMASLVGADAGSWFGRAWAGEPIPMLDEALELLDPSGAPPLHMIELKEPGLVPLLADRLRSVEPRPAVRVASTDPAELAHAQDHGLPAMLLVDRVDDEALELIARRRYEAIGFGPGGWRTPAFARLPKGLERWGWAIDRPDELLAACTLGLHGLNTNEPHRALAARALARLAPDCRSWPVEAPVLPVVPEQHAVDDPVHGTWSGRWADQVTIHNPLPVEVEARVGFFARGGAFEVEGLPAAFRLAPGASRSLPLRIAGGSRRPGPDPLVGALLSWQGSLWPGGGGGGRADLAAGGRLLLDAPLERRRVAWAEPLSARLELLREDPADPRATVTLRRRGRRIALRIEDPGGLTDPVVHARLGELTVQGSPAVELVLPPEFDQLAEGLPFSVALVGERSGTRIWRRWAGGLPEGLENGEPGRLLPAPGA